MPPSGPTLSAIVPVYNEEAVLPLLYDRLTEVLGRAVDSYEILLVNDGSGDRSRAIISTLVRSDARVRGIHLSRNFGHQAAVAAGLQHSRGRAAVVLDADLQDPPELIGEMLARWRDGFEVVNAQRTRREGEPGLKRALAFGYYRLLRKLTRIEIPPDTGDFCLMDRCVVDALNALPERNRFVRGLRAWVGFRQTTVPFTRPGRAAGAPKYTIGRSFALGLNGVLALSKLPLRLATYLGLFISFSSFVLATVFIYERLFGASLVPGWASTVVTVLFLGGVQLLTIGIIGEYLSRIYDEVKQRPLYIVHERDGFDDTGGTSSVRPAAEGCAGITPRAPVLQ
jgi:dolichol-phosphate mannosyltransferase